MVMRAVLTARAHGSDTPGTRRREVDAMTVLPRTVTLWPGLTLLGHPPADEPAPMREFDQFPVRIVHPHRFDEGHQ